MIKAIYFDFDGVLSPDKNDGHTTCMNLSNVTGIDFDTLYKAYSPFLERLYAGKITNKELWNDFCKAVGKDIDIGLLEPALKDAPKNEEMLQLAKTLKKNGYPVGVITNQAVDRYDLLKDDFELESVFAPVIVSAKIGCTKRGEFGGEEIFNAALRPHDLKPDECVFIDNSESNLTIPKAMGFHTYFHDDSKNDVPAFVTWLKELEVNV
ncbi:MAG: HAD hydrolase-like protein [Candidatus Pacebacteria bacterium]|nr:HAD hydrolase-like protein [Candidatus Paceibacterota bacterium]